MAKETQEDYRPSRRHKALAGVASLAVAGSLAGGPVASAANRRGSLATAIENTAQGKPDGFKFTTVDGKMTKNDREAAKQLEQKFRAKGKMLEKLDKSGKVKIFPGALEIRVLDFKDPAFHGLPFYDFYEGPGSPRNMPTNDPGVRIVEMFRIAEINGVPCIIARQDLSGTTNPNQDVSDSPENKEANMSVARSIAAQVFAPLPELNKMVKQGLILMTLWGTRQDENPKLVGQKIVDGHYRLDDPRYANGVTPQATRVGRIIGFDEINNSLLDEQIPQDVDKGGIESYIQRHRGFIPLSSHYKSEFDIDLRPQSQ